MPRYNDAEMDQLLAELGRQTREKAHPLPKDLFWAGLEKDLKRKMIQKRNPQMRKWIFRAVAACAVIALGFALTMPQQVSAFTNRLVTVMKTVVVGSEGNISFGYISAAPSQGRQLLRLPPEAETLFQQIDFPALYPTYLPDVYGWSRGEHEQPAETSGFVRLVFEGRDGKLLTVWQNYSRDWGAGGIFFDADDTQVEDAQVCGLPAKFLIFKDGSQKLMWQKEDLSIILSGFVPKEELFHVAESLKDPEVGF